MSKDELFDKAMKEIVEKDNSIIVDEFELTGVDLRPYDLGGEDKFGRN